MTLVKVLLFVAILAISLPLSAEYTPADYANMDIVQGITYIQDHRVNLCYAKYDSGRNEYRVGGITLVPCENVKPLLINP